MRQKKKKQKVMECCSKTALEQKFIKIGRRKSEDSIVRKPFVVKGPGFGPLRFAKVKRKSC